MAAKLWRPASSIYANIDEAQNSATGTIIGVVIGVALTATLFLF